MLTCLIVDDDIHSRNILKAMLEAEHGQMLGIPYMAGSMEEALVLIQDVKPDLVFLDVELQDGTGFDILDKTEHRNFKFIFTTAHDAYAIKAFKVNATDYLLKPFSPEELRQALQKVAHQAGSLNQRPEVQMLIDYMNGNRNRIALPVQSGYEFISVSLIIRCSAEGNYTRFYLKTGQTYLVSKTLRVYENLLEADGFCRVHASHLINLKEIKSYQKGDGGYLVMSDGTGVEVSRSRREAFISKIRV